MLDIVNIAIGEPQDNQIKTSGWWVIAPNRCADVISDDLQTRYIYLHAVDVRGKSILQGEQSFCIGLRQFNIAGMEDCWTRGHLKGTFQEVDTQDSESWTIFLREPTNNNPVN